MIAGNLHGAFVVWRSKGDPDTIRDWGIYQFPLEPDPRGWVPEVITEARVPIYYDGKQVTEEDMKRAVKVLQDTLVNEVQTRSDLARLRQQFHRVAEKGRSKPEVEVVDDREFQQIWRRAWVPNAT